MEGKKSKIAMDTQKESLCSITSLNFLWGNEQRLKKIN